MRSASSIMALDQMRDNVFQSQVQRMSDFIRDTLILYVQWFSTSSGKEYVETDEAGDPLIDWSQVLATIQSSRINLKPVKLLDPTGDENAQNSMVDLDYTNLMNARALAKVCNGEMDYDDVPYFIDKNALLCLVAMNLVKYSARGITITDNMHRFLARGFIEAIKKGQVQL